MTAPRGLSGQCQAVLILGLGPRLQATQCLRYLREPQNLRLNQPQRRTAFEQYYASLVSYYSVHRITVAGGTAAATIRGITQRLQFSKRLMGEDSIR